MPRFLKKLIVNIVLLALVATFTGCDNKENIEIFKEVKSPNGYYTAYAAIWSNGATTPFESRVAVISSKEDVDKLLSEGGNVYSATRSYDKKVDIKWEDDDTLLITYSNEDSDIYNKSDIFHGINIKYGKKSGGNL